MSCSVVSGDIQYIKTSGWVIVLSVDPGTENFAFYFEQRVFSPSDKFCKSIMLLDAGRVSIKQNMYGMIHDLLFNNQYMKYCSVLVIERQMINQDMISVMNYTIGLFVMYMLCNQRPYAVVVVGPGLRKLLGYVKGTDAKKWASQTGEVLLYKRYDTNGQKQINSIVGRHHDIYDAVNYIELAFKKLGLPCTAELVTVTL